MSSTDPAVVPHRIEVDALMGDIITNGMGELPDGVDADGVRRVMTHVWASAINNWVGGMAPTGSVAAELQRATKLLLGTVDGSSDGDGVSESPAASRSTAPAAAAGCSGSRRPGRIPSAVAPATAVRSRRPRR